MRSIFLTAILLWPILVAILADIYSQTSLVTCILVNWNRYRETIACLGRRSQRLTARSTSQLSIMPRTMTLLTGFAARIYRETYRDGTKFGFRRLQLSTEETRLEADGRWKPHVQHENGASTDRDRAARAGRSLLPVFGFCARIRPRRGYRYH